MSTKTIIIALTVSFIVGLGVGHYARPDKAIETSKTDSKDTKTDKKATDEKKNEHKRTMIVKKPDGTTTTSIDDVINSDTHEEDKSTEVADTHTETTKETVYNTNKLNISVLAGPSFPINALHPYNLGISLSKDLLGPITIGVWSFPIGNKSAGFSLGVNL